MKKKTFLPAGFASAFLLAFAVSLGCVFCLITAFTIPADGRWVATGCFAFALCFSLAFSLPKSWIWVLVILTAAALLVYTRLEAVLSGCSVLLETITGWYSLAFTAVPVVHLLPELPGRTEATAFLILMAMIPAAVTAWTVLKRRLLWSEALVCLLPLGISLVIIETVPAAWTILLLSVSLGLLAVTQSLRRQTAKAGHRLTLQLLLPIAALALLLTLLFPPSAYSRTDWSESLQTKMTEFVDKLAIFRINDQTGNVEFVSPFAPSTLGSRVWDSSVSQVNLNNVGPQRQTGRHVMDIYSEESGAIYLRADSMATYDNNSWSALDESLYTDAGIASTSLLTVAPASSQLQISTDMKASVYYVPYKPTALPATAIVEGDAYIRNPLQETEYTIDYVNRMVSADVSQTYMDFVGQNYLYVPDETRQALGGVLDELSVYDGGDAATIAAGVSGYVSSSATYSLNTPRVPAGEDFVAWFLTQSDTGYCVHFATATTILLRAMGVPARYVTGYLADSASGEWSAVTADQAHAWVEYYVYGTGWVLLDPTPAASEVSPDEPVAPDNQPETNPSTSDNKPEQGSSTQTPEPVTTPEPQPAQPSKQTSVVWKIVWGILSAALLLLLYRTCVFFLRSYRLRKGPVNRRAVACYHHVVFLSAKAGREVPERLQELALKARFGPHKIAREELNEFYAAASELTDILLENKNFFHQFLYRVIYALK